MELERLAWAPVALARGKMGIVTEKRTDIGYCAASPHGYLALRCLGRGGTDYILADSRVAGTGTIRLYGLRTTLIDITPSMYAYATAALVSSICYQDRNVLDLGCGDMILGFLAAKRGAKKVYGIEKGEDFATVFEKNLEINEFPGCSLTHITGSFRSSRTLGKVRDTIDTVIANIGPHEIYGDAHEAAIRVAGRRESVTRLIIGGYVATPVHPYEKIKQHPLYYGPAFDLAKQYGFAPQEFCEICHAWEERFVPAVSILFER